MNQVALSLTLAVAVPIEIDNLRAADDELRAQLIAAHTSQSVTTLLGAHGDQLLYGGPQCAETFAGLARGLAGLAWQPGGVDVLGMHFCADHSLCREAAEEAERHPHLRPPEPPARRPIEDVHLP